MSTKLYKTSIPLAARKITEKGSYNKAFSKYISSMANIMEKNENVNSDFVEDLRGFMRKQPDLLYGLSILVSEGRNKNGDGFLRPVLAEIFDTPRHKFVDFEHDVEGENPKGKNPEKYQVVGHIYDSQLSLQENFEYIPDHDVYRDLDGKWFPEGSSWRNKPLEIVVAWVLYQFEYPELAQMVRNEFGMQSAFGLESSTFGVSMEVLFSDFKYRVGSFDPAEEFDFDATTIGAVEARKGEEFAEELGKLWRRGQQYKGQPITRILGGDIFFSGMAITKNKANPRSWNLSVANKTAFEAAEASAQKSGDSHFFSLLRAVAEKSENKFEMDKCEIVNGEPSCACLENALASQVEEVTQKINTLASELEAIAAEFDTFEDDEDLFFENDEFLDGVTRLREGVRQAQKRLRNLFENNLDLELSGEEILEFVQEIEETIRESRVGFAKLNTEGSDRLKKPSATSVNAKKNYRKIEQE